MKILLLHALNPEAKLIKQQFPQQTDILSKQGMSLMKLDEQFDILRTGMGLPRTQAALQHIPKLDTYDLLLQFGVSGSLSDELPVHALICARQFSALDEPQIELESVNHFSLPDIKQVGFYSSLEVVSDEASRQVAVSHGAQAVDMESFAVAKFCQTNRIPLLAIRIISDRAGASTPEEFRQNFKQASLALQKYLIKHVLKI